MEQFYKNREVTLSVKRKVQVRGLTKRINYDIMIARRAVSQNLDML